MNFVGLFATQSQVEYIITRPHPPSEYQSNYGVNSLKKEFTYYAIHCLCVKNHIMVRSIKLTDRQQQL